MEEKWLYTISAKRSNWSLNLLEIWRYRDLLMLFVKRDLVTVYKQTILGPLWYFIQPLLTSVIFTLIFNNIAAIDTGIVPAFLFNLAGITLWNYFKVCLTGTSNTFKQNAAIFGKVYSPRFIVPLSKVLSNLVKLLIQMLILAGFYVYFVVVEDRALSPDAHMLLLPVYIALMAIYGLGMGMILSTMTTKYRDLSILLSFIVQLLMYVSAVPYPIGQLKAKVPEYSWIVDYNPLAQLIEGFRFALFNAEGLEFSWTNLLITAVVGLLLFILGLALFNRTEKNFIDTV